MRGHVDAESLALCAEGLLSRRRSERVRAHVTSCPGCAAAHARLTEVPALLARVPPPSLSPGIEARLDAALSTEVARRAAQDAVVAPGRSGPEHVGREHVGPDHVGPELHPGAVPTPGPPRWWRPRLPVAARVLAAAGVVVVVAGVGYAVAQSSSSPSTSRSSSGAVSEPTAGASSAGSLPLHASANAPGGGGATFTVTHSGTRYHRGTLPAQAAGVLAHSSTGLIRPGGAVGRSRRPGLDLTGCVLRVAGAPAVDAGEVKLVDEARYRGRPATVIVVAATPTRPGRVYVAGTRCSSSDSDILAEARLR